MEKFVVMALNRIVYQCDSEKKAEQKKMSLLRQIETEINDDERVQVAMPTWGIEVKKIILN